VNFPHRTAYRLFASSAISEQLGYRVERDLHRVDVEDREGLTYTKVCSRWIEVEAIRERFCLSKKPCPVMEHRVEEFSILVLVEISVGSSSLLVIGELERVGVSMTRVFYEPRSLLL